MQKQKRRQRICWPVSAVRSSVGQNLAQTYFTTLALSGEPYLEVLLQEFFSLNCGTINISGQDIFCCFGLSCVLWDI